MTLDMNGIKNENEFFTTHYIAAMLEGDLDPLVRSWKEEAETTAHPTPARLLQEWGRRWLKRDRSGAATEENLLPELLEILGYEPALAMTIHQSQGSSFGEVLIVLPDRESPVLTRELLYTAITRARRRVELWAKQAMIEAALRNRTRRNSGLPVRMAEFAALERIPELPSFQSGIPE